MSLHVFAALVTAQGTAANNRGLTEGNITTLQKLVWGGQVHTTVSAESIRFAVRRRLGEKEDCNRIYDDETRESEWRDAKFAAWGQKGGAKTYVDDDLLGFMSAEAAIEERGKGTALIRRAVLEVARAVSLTPWPGDVTFNAASPGATPSAQKKGSNPVPYGTEMHATRYQYGIAMTPARLRDPKRASTALRALCALGEVAGNHGRFLFDFSPESVVFRITDEPAPRILYAFAPNGSDHVAIPEILRKVLAGDIAAKELVVGGQVEGQLGAKDRTVLAGATLVAGIKAACEEVCRRLPGGGK